MNRRYGIWIEYLSRSVLTGVLGWGSLRLASALPIPGFRVVRFNIVRIC